MTYKLIILSFLVVAINVLPSSKGSICVNTIKDSLKSKDTCVQAKTVTGENKKQTAVVKEKTNNNATAPLADYKMPVIPFSRFIL